MNKLWDEAELKWIKTLSNSPKSSSHATQLSISFRNKANILIWCGFVQLPQNLLCRNKTNWTEKILEEKPPQTHTECFRSCQASPGVVETTASAAWQESKSPSDTSIKSDGEVCVCSHPFMCKRVTFQKKPSTIWTLLYWMCFQSGWWRVKQRLQQAGTTTETMPPTETPPPTCMRWRIITEFVFHTSVDQCLCAILLNSKMCIHLFINVLHTSYIRQRRMFTACSEKGLLLLFLTCHRTCTVDRTSLTGNNFPLVNISTEIFTKHTRHNCCKYFLITLYTFIPHQWLKSDLNRILS